MDDSLIGRFAKTIATQNKKYFYFLLPLFFLAAPLSLHAASITTQFGSYISTSLGSKLYINNFGSNTVSVIDTNTNTVIKTIPVGAGPEWSTVVGKKVYVGNNDFGDGDQSVSIIDTLTDTVVGTTTVGANPTTQGLVGTKLYVPSQQDNAVYVIDTNTNTVLTTIPVGNNPLTALLVGTKFYVANASGQSVSIIDTLTDSVVATPTTGAFPYLPVYAANKVFVLNSSDASISVINPSTNTVSTTFAVGGFPVYGTVVGNKIFVSNAASGTVSVVDAVNNTVSATVTVGGGTGYSILSNSKLYVTNTASGTVSVINTSTNSVIKTITVDSAPQWALTYGSRVYIIDNNGTVTVIDSLNDNVIDPLAPVLTSFTSATANGAYTTGKAINITANFGSAINATSTMTVVLNTGATVTLSAVSGTQLSGTYVVGSGNSAVPDLTVLSISSASIGDAATNGTHRNTSFSVPASPQLTGDTNGNIGDTSNIAIKKNYFTIPVGTNPYQMTTVGTVVYVSNEGSNTVSVVDSSNNTVLTTVPVGFEPYGIAYATSTKEIYVANIASNTVSVINADPSSGGSYNTVTNTIPVGVRPFYVAIMGAKAYVSNKQSNTVSVISTGSHTVSATVGVGTGPLGVKVLGTSVYVSNSNTSSDYSSTGEGGTVSVISTATNAVTNVIPVGSGPRGITINGTDVYIANFQGNTVSVIDDTSKTVTHVISVGMGPRGLFASGGTIYVENWMDGTISVINGSTYAVTATVPVGNTPAGMSTVSTLLYLSRFTDNVLSIFDTSTNTLNSSTISVSTPTSANKTINIPNIDKGLIGHWTFDGKDMLSNVKDTSGQGNNATLTSFTATTTVTGAIGQALSFTGTTQNVNTGSRQGPQTGATFSAWIKPSSVSTTQGILTQYTDFSNSYMQFYISSGGVVTGRITNGDASLIGRTTGAGAVTTKWQHVLYTWDGGTTNASIKIYVNGVRADTTNDGVGSFTGPYAGSGVPLIIGNQRTSDIPFNGAIDDVREYNRALSAAEVTQLYKSNAAAANKTVNVAAIDVGLVGHWTFDGKDMLTNVKDTSGSGINGYLYGYTATSSTPGKIGQALSFDSTQSQFVRMNATPTNATANVSVSAWVYVPTISQKGSFLHNGFSTGTDPQSDGFGLGVGNSDLDTNGNHLVGILDNVVWMDFNINIGTGWHFVSMTRDATTWRGYVDGVVGGTTYTNTPNTPTGNFSIGTDNTGATRYFNGKIDDVRIYNRRLSGSEITQLYKASTVRLK